MGETRSVVRFLLNDEVVELTDLPATRTLLDFLRIDCLLIGSKEGCAEGDCGACTVLVGRLEQGEIRYRSINACIAFVAALDGAHVVTIEHLSRTDGPLHPVQQAMVDFHGSQCGFCTPGIVMSLYGLWMETGDPKISDVEEALQGNLCRCTGYAPIVRAGLSREEYWDETVDPLIVERESVLSTLAEFADGIRVVGGTAEERFILPASVDDLAAVLDEMPEARIVGGATDVGLWVTKFMRDITPVVFTTHLTDFHRIETDAHLDGQTGVIFAGGVSYTEALPVIDEHFPQMSDLWRRIGGQQVRNAGTIGGNIANGSPIGDTPPPLIALGAKIVLRRGSGHRIVPLEDFFIAYGEQDRRPGELVERIFVPYPDPADIFAVHKISKRRDEDISALCGAFRIKVANGTVQTAVIAFGGMAAIPKRAKAVEAALVGQPWSEATVAAAQAAFAEDFAPISDMRASADYRLLTAENLLQRVFLESQGLGETLTRGAK